MRTILLTVGLLTLTPSIQAGAKSHWCWRWLIWKRCVTSSETTQKPTPSPYNSTYSCVISNFVPVSIKIENITNITLRIDVIHNMLGRTNDTSCISYKDENASRKYAQLTIEIPARYSFQLFIGHIAAILRVSNEVCRRIENDAHEGNDCNITCPLDIRNSSDGESPELVCAEVSTTTTTTNMQNATSKEETSHSTVSKQTTVSSQTTAEPKMDQSKQDTRLKSVIWVIAPVAGVIVLIIVLLIVCWKIRKRKRPRDGATELSTIHTAEQQTTNVYDLEPTVTAETKENPLYDARDDDTGREMVDNVLYGST